MASTLAASSAALLTTTPAVRMANQHHGAVELPCAAGDVGGVVMDAAQGMSNCDHGYMVTLQFRRSQRSNGCVGERAVDQYDGGQQGVGHASMLGAPPPSRLPSDDSSTRRWTTLPDGPDGVPRVIEHLDHGPCWRGQSAGTAQQRLQPLCPNLRVLERAA